MGLEYIENVILTTIAVVLFGVSGIIGWGVQRFIDELRELRRSLGENIRAMESRMAYIEGRINGQKGGENSDQ